MAIFSIARLTYIEALRQPLGLVLSLILGTLALFSPSYTTFALGRGLDLLRSNLLSTLMVGGVIFASLLSTSLVHRDLQRKTLLTILSRPVSIPSYYLGKWLGISALLLHFWVIMVGVCWTAMALGAPDSQSTARNFIPLITLALGLLVIFFLALILNYSFDLPIISFIFGGWALWTPLTVLLSLLLSPTFGLSLPESRPAFQFIFSAVLLGSMILVIASFSMALSTSTSSVVNMILCLLFLFLGLMGPGLESALGALHPFFRSVAGLLPDFHLLWTGDWLSLDQAIPLDHLLGSLLYSLSLMASFSSLGVYAMMKKDLS